MTTIDEARAEAYRKEGDARTIERIAARMVDQSKCPPGKCPGKRVAGCQAHWVQYLTGEVAE